MLFVVFVVVVVVDVYVWVRPFASFPSSRYIHFYLILPIVSFQIAFRHTVSHLGGSGRTIGPESRFFFCQNHRKRPLNSQANVHVSYGKQWTIRRYCGCFVLCMCVFVATILPLGESPWRIITGCKWVYLLDGTPVERQSESVCPIRGPLNCDRVCDGHHGTSRRDGGTDIIAITIALLLDCCLPDTCGPVDVLFGYVY